MPFNPHIKTIVDNLKKEIVDTLQNNPEVIKNFAALGITPTKENLEEIADQLIENTTKLKDVEGNNQWLTFKTLSGWFQENKLIPKNLTEDQIDHILNIQEQITTPAQTQEAKILFGYTSQIKEDLMNRSISKLKEDNPYLSGELAKEAIDELWLQLPSPHLTTLSDNELEKETTRLIQKSFEDAFEDRMGRKKYKVNLPNNLSGISQEIAHDSVDDIKSITQAQPFEISKSIFLKSQKEIITELSGAGVLPETAIKTAVDITSEVIIEKEDFVKLTKTINKEKDPTKKTILQNNLHNRQKEVIEKILKQQKITPDPVLIDNINSKLSPHTQRLITGAQPARLPDDLQITRGQAFGPIYALFDPGAGIRSFEKQILGGPLTLLSYSLVGKSDIQKWAQGKGEGLFARWVGKRSTYASFVNEIELALGGASSQSLASQLQKITGNSFSDKVYRTITGIGQPIGKNDDAAIKLRFQIGRMQDFEKTTLGKIFKFYNDRLAQPFLGEFTAWGLLNIKRSKLLSLLISAPEEIPNIIIKQLTTHVIRLSVGRFLNWVGLKSGLYITIKKDGQKIIVFNGIKQLKSWLRQTALGTKLVRSKIFQKIIVLLGKLALALSEIMSIIGIILLIKDLWPIIKKTTEKAIKTMLFSFIVIIHTAGGVIAGATGALLRTVQGAVFSMGGALGSLPTIGSNIISGIISIKASVLSPQAFASAGSVLLTIGITGGIAIFAGEGGPAFDSEYISLEVTAQPTQLSSGDIKFTIEITPKNTKSININLRNVSISESLTNTPSDLTVNLDKKNIDTNNCPNINKELTKIGLIKSGQKCTYSFTVNVPTQEKVKDGTITESITVKADAVNAQSGIVINPPTEGSNDKTKVATAKIGKGAPDSTPHGWPMAGRFTQGEKTPPKWSHHNINAIDIANSGLAYIVATHTGKVVAANNNCHNNTKSEGFGCYVKIQGTYKGKTFFSLYGHMVPGSVRVKKDDPVNAGTILGQEGGSGWAEGALSIVKGDWVFGRHLHYQIYRTDTGNSYDSYELNSEGFIPHGVPIGCTSDAWCNRNGAADEKDISK